MAAEKRKREDEIDIIIKNIQRNKEDLEINTAKKGRVEENIKVLTKKIKRNEDDLELNVAKKRAVEEEIDILTRKIKKNEEDIETNMTEKRRFEEEIDTLTEKIKKNEEDIEVNVAEKQRVEEDIYVLTKKIKVEEEEEARQPEESGHTEHYEQESNPKETLRRNIQLWLETYPFLSPHTTCKGIKDLLSLRNIEDKSYEDWHNEVIYLRDVQRNLTYAAHYSRNSSNQHEQIDLTSALMQILHPFDKIEKRRFPNLKEIIEDPEEHSDSTDLDFSSVINPKQITEFLRNVFRRIPKKTGSQEVYLIGSQKKLELMMRLFSESKSEIYEYLLTAGVLQIFGFKVHRFQFDYHLSKNDFKNMSKMLEDHRKMFNSIEQPSQQQAYILNLALCCVDQKETAIRYAFDTMSGDIETELQEVWAPMVNGSVDVVKLQHIADQLLTEEQKKAKRAKFGTQH